MAKIQKKDGSLVIKKSFWSAISIWWTLVFFIGAPVGGFILRTNEDYGMIALAAGAAVSVISLIVLIVKLICVKKTSWTFYDGAVIYKKGRVFYAEEVTRDMEFFPGMSVSVRRTVKGKFCSYGDVVISNGAGEAGEIVMLGKARGTKNGNKMLTQQIEAVGGIDFTKPYAFGYSGLEDDLLQKYIADNEDIWVRQGEELPVGTIGGTIGTHAGPGAFGYAFFAK